VVLAAVALLAAFKFTMAAYGRDFARRGILIILATGMLSFAHMANIHPRNLRTTQLNENYTILQIRGDTLIFGAPTGGEWEALRYLRMRRVRSASLVLTTIPRHADVPRLASLAPYIHTIYISAHPEGAAAGIRTAALQELQRTVPQHMPRIVYIHHGDIRRAHGTALQFSAGEMGRLDFILIQ
jgi:hypothetical protein